MTGQQFDFDAFEQFRQWYALQHPASIPEKPVVQSVYPPWLWLLIVLMMLSAALLSAVHTVPTVHDLIPAAPIVPTPLRTVAAWGASGAVELSLFVAAYLTITKDKLLAYGVLLTSGLVALVANITSIARAAGGIESGRIGTIAVTIILGVGMPLIAFMAGKLLVNIHRINRQTRQQAEQAYREMQKEWDAKVLAAWTKHRKVDKRVSVRTDMDGRNGRSGTLSVHSDSMDGRGRTGYGYGRAANASEIVRAYLAEHPDDVDAPVRVLASKLGVGKSTVSAVQREVRNTQ